MKRLYFILLIVLLAVSNGYSQLYTGSGISFNGLVQGSADFGDYNNDGFQDILLTGSSDIEPSAIIYKNNGDNTFTEQTAIVLPGIVIGCVKWADFDNDNDLDILLTGSTTGNTLNAISKVYRNDGGTFNEIASGLPGVYLSSVSIADQDRDGDLDIFMTGMRTTGERISSIFNNNGDGTFVQLPGTSFTQVCYGFAAFGDYDNDGFPDILISGQTASITRISKVYHNNGNGTYSEQTGIVLQGLSYNSGAWSDFNGDGYADIILTGEDASFMPVTKIYFNNKAGNFTELAGTGIGGAKKCAVATGDLDNDGDADVIISGIRSNTCISQVYINNGNGTFTINNSSPTGTTESSIAISDYDNDGDLDFLLAGITQSGTLISKIYSNNSSTPNIKPAKPSNLAFTIDRTTAAFSWDRVTGDETPSASLSYNVRIGPGSTSSEKVSPQAAITGARKITSSGNSGLNNKFTFRNMRWNTSYYASVQCLDNSYAGSDFSSAVNFQITPKQPKCLTGSNLSTTSLLLKWKRGNGDKCIVFAKEGTSGPAAPVNNTTYYANDNFGDGSPLSGGWFCIYKGEADSVVLRNLVPEKDYTVHAIEFQGGWGSETYATVTNPDNDNIGVFSSGIFTVLSGTAMPGLRFSSVAWGDYDNDGYLDILLTGRNIAGDDVSKVFRNNGNNTFTDRTEIVLQGVETGSSAWGDYNNDGLLDIVLTGYSPSTGAISRIYKNNGSNSFTEQTGISLTGVMYSSAAWGDYDNDSDLDLLITGSLLSGTPVSKIYRNNGDNTFTEQTGISLTGVKQGSAAFGDYNNDGLTDILLSGQNAASLNVTKLYKNTGNNTFSEQTGIQLKGVSFSSVAWGDYDNDNNLDILLTGASGYSPDFLPVTKVYRNTGNDSFTEINGSFKAVNNGSAEWGDYNNDGLLDMLVIGDSGFNYEFRIYLNKGNNTFSELTSLILPGAIACGASSADYDSDGDLDILFSGYSGALLSQIYRNNLYLLAGKVKPNKKPEPPAGLKSEVSPRTLKLSWSGVKTDETFYVNMSYNVKCKMANGSVWTVTPQATTDGFRSLNDLGNAQLSRSLIIKDPPSGKYYWQVQAVDQSYSGSAWSSVDSVIIKNTQAFFRTDTVCLGSSTTFTDQSIAADGLSSWQWDFNDGTTSSFRNPVHKYATAGTFGVKLTVTSTTGAKDILTQNVIVKGKPSPDFSAPNICIGSPTQIANSSNLHGLAVSKWMWDFGDGQTSTTQNPVSHNYALSGTYQSKLKIISTNGCSDSITKSVIVARYPESAISVAGDFTTVSGKLTFCEGINLQLSAKNDPLYTYQWRKDDNDLTGAASSSFTVSKNSGIYNAVITNTLANCVTVSEQKPIDIKKSPAKPVVISDNYKTGDCVGENPVRLKVEQSVSNYGYAWLRNGIPINNAASTYLEDFLDQGDYVVSAEMNGCAVKSEKFSISYQGAPEKPLVYAQGPVKWYLACNNLTASKYIWYFNEKPIDGALKYYYSADQKYGSYRVSVGDSKGCFTRSDTINIPTKKFTAVQGSKSVRDPFAGLKLYPNPSSGIIRVDLDNELYGDLYIRVITQGGKEIMNKKFIKASSAFSELIDLSGQIRGSYVVKVSLDDNFTTHQIILR